MQGLSCLCQSSFVIESLLRKSNNNYFKNSSFEMGSNPLLRMINNSHLLRISNWKLYCGVASHISNKGYVFILYTNVLKKLYYLQLPHWMWHYFSVILTNISLFFDPYRLITYTPLLDLNQYYLYSTFNKMTNFKRFCENYSQIKSVCMCPITFPSNRCLYQLYKGQWVAFFIILPLSLIVKSPVIPSLHDPTFVNIIWK